MRPNKKNLFSFHSKHLNGVIHCMRVTLVGWPSMKFQTQIYATHPHLNMISSVTRFYPPQSHSLKMMSSTFFLLLLVPVILSSDCPLNLNREIGSTRDYVLVCKCPFPSLPSISEPSNLAFARSPIPASNLDTQGHHQSFIHCLSSRTPSLSPLCLSDPFLFEKRATEAMSSCRHVPLTSAQKQMNKAFSFSTQQCEVRLVPIVSTFQVGGIWLCECAQDFNQNELTFDVVVGRGNFTTQVAPGGGESEIELLRECTDIMKDELKRVCLQASGDFDLLALHLLQACCKRARVGKKEKFDCANWVPANVDELKIQRDPLVRALDTGK